MERFFGGCAFIWIWRDDLVAQAVSWAKATQTGVWYDHLSRRPAARAVFDFDEIERLLREVADHNKPWQLWFAANQIEPLAIRYEDLASDKVGTTRRALAFLGVEIPDALRIVEQTRRQRDALNDEWSKRFRELAGGAPMR